MHSELDDVDKKIIQALTDNARMPVSDLSRLVNLSRNAVTHRIQRLEKSNIIKGYQVILSDGLPVKDAVVAIMMVYRKDRMRGKEVIKYVEKVSEVVSCYIMSGDYDVILNVQARSHERIHEIWQDISALSSVDDTRTTFVLSVVKM
jgi:DNA-binding Lrp family transcriptional regulator|tara:strand:- start:4717 stop:5157 length:441 start_codon:yes stop_codon:yes gene_type:complete